MKCKSAFAILVVLFMLLNGLSVVTTYANFSSNKINQVVNADSLLASSAHKVRKPGVIDSIIIDPFDNPVGAALDSSNGNVYVANSKSCSVSVINGSTNTVDKIITVGSSITFP